MLYFSFGYSLPLTFMNILLNVSLKNSAIEEIFATLKNAVIIRKSECSAKFSHIFILNSSMNISLFIRM